MKWNLNKKRVALIFSGLLLVSALAAPQLQQLLKIGGVAAVVNTFGKDINKSFNKLWGRNEGRNLKTKVVPILSVGKRGNAIGIAQVMGPPMDVDEVVAVAQPELPLMGLRLRALIPVSSRNVIEDIKVVENVGVSGIIDIKL
jgi:hypothetical protein